MALWDGRFSGGPGDDMVAFSQSLDTDMRMWREDIEGSRAHVTMLGEVGLLVGERQLRAATWLDRDRLFL